MDELFHLLGEYKADRQRWPTFALFMLRNVECYHDLASRIGEGMADYDAVPNATGLT